MSMHILDSMYTHILERYTAVETSHDLLYWSTY
jgi:hypothetical protein